MKHDPPLPQIELLDVVTDDLNRAIDEGGGVRSLDLTVTDGSSKNENMWYSQSLAALKDRISGARRVKVHWEAGDGDISAEDVASLAEEFRGDESGLDNFVINLKKSPSIKNLSNYKVSTEINVQLIGSALAVSEVESGLWGYLDALRTPNDGGWRIIDADGFLSNGVKKKF